MTWKHSYGKPDYYQFKNDMLNGYGIETYGDGRVYRGEFKDNSRDGYGLMKYKNNDEYDGQCKFRERHG